MGTADPQRCCSYTNTDADRDGKAVQHIDDGPRGRADKWRQRQRRRGAIAADVGRLQRPIISLEVRRDAAHARSSGCAPVRLGCQNESRFAASSSSLGMCEPSDAPRPVQLAVQPRWVRCGKPTELCSRARPPSTTELQSMSSAKVSRPRLVSRCLPLPTTIDSASDLCVLVRLSAPASARGARLAAPTRAGEF